MILPFPSQPLASEVCLRSLWLRNKEGRQTNKWQGKKQLAFLVCVCVCVYVFKFIYLESEGGTKRIPSRLPAVSIEPNAGSDPTNREITT